jgi:hypothetical protein
VHVKVWENAEAHFDSFLAAVKLWRYVKDYNPVPLACLDARPELN